MPQRRLAIAVIALALLVTSCAGPVDAEEPIAAPMTEPSPTLTMEPTAPAPIAPGEQVVPATCDELIPASQARLDLEFEQRDTQSVGAVIGVTAGLLTCQRGPVAPGFDAAVYVLAVPPPDWQAQLRDAGATEANGVLIQRICSEDTSFCGARLATDAYAAELFVTDYAATGTIGSELDAIASELAVTLGGLPEPSERPLPSEQTFQIPEGCAAIDILDSPVADEIAPLLANRELYPGSDDGPWLYYAAEGRIGAFWCRWSDGSDSLELHVVPGGGWAVDEPGWMLSGAVLDVEGADAARWSDSPFQEETAMVVARIGDDLVMLTLSDSSADGVIAEDRVDLAERVLEAFIESLLDVSR